MTFAKRLLGKPVAGRDSDCTNQLQRTAAGTGNFDITAGFNRRQHLAETLASTVIIGVGKVIWPTTVHDLFRCSHRMLTTLHGGFNDKATKDEIKNEGTTVCGLSKCVRKDNRIIFTMGATADFPHPARLGLPGKYARVLKSSSSWKQGRRKIWKNFQSFGRNNHQTEHPALPFIVIVF